jgi:hypothetical protein
LRFDRGKGAGFSPKIWPEYFGHYIEVTVPAEAPNAVAEG